MTVDALSSVRKWGHQPTAIQTKPKVLRPDGYQYLRILREHLNNDLGRIFNGELIYPRQLEFHLPGDGKRACLFNCGHCQGRMSRDALGLDGRQVVELLQEVAGESPYSIFGGQYTEPTLSPHLLDCIKAVKRHGSNFGITTNGSMFKQLEQASNWVSELVEITTPGDYITVSLDAGFSESHMKSKKTDRNYFDDIIEGLRLLQSVREQMRKPLVLRICYLFNKWNEAVAEVENIVRIVKDIGLDSLRFSIPYAIYGLNFSKVRKYKQTTELPQDRRVRAMLTPYLSKSLEEFPYIFYFGPFFQDVDRMNYRHCIHGYYQITIAADGYAYKCSSIAQPLFKYGRLGKCPRSKEELDRLIVKNYDPDFNCNTCFKNGARCNRIALENNYYYNQQYRLR